MYCNYVCKLYICTNMNKESINAGRQLKLFRELRGLSQSELCEKIDGLSQPNLSKFEAGYSVISESKIDKICEQLNMPKEFLNRKFVYLQRW